VEQTLYVGHSWPTQVSTFVGEEEKVPGKKDKRDIVKKSSTVTTNIKFQIRNEFKISFIMCKKWDIVNQVSGSDDGICDPEIMG
jgi:hypothetical protein